MWLCILVVNMTELHCDVREEQIPVAFCKIHGLLGKCVSEIKTDLDLVYGENSLPYGTIARWVSMFKDGRTNVKDDPGIINAIADEDARYTVEVPEISDISGLSAS
jgi:hypothetical protein